MSTGKTSTFTIHHDRCDPSKWTIAEWKLLAKFVKFGALQDAAGLSRFGMQLVLSDHHTPTGGALEEVGWAVAGSTDEITEDLADIADDDITAVQKIYRGPVVYAVRYGTGDGDGNFEGWEYETRPSEAEAQELSKEIEAEAARQSGRADA